MARPVGTDPGSTATGLQSSLTAACSVLIVQCLTTHYQYAPAYVPGSGGVPETSLLYLIASHTRLDRQGMSMLRTPRWAMASITALTKAAGPPTQPHSPMPLHPIGWWGEGGTTSYSLKVGTSQAVGIM